MKYVEVYPWRVEDEVKAGFEVRYLNKSTGKVGFVRELAYSSALKMIADEGEKYYFWKREVYETEKPQATEEASE